jgi:hypothetical protein
VSTPAIEMTREAWAQGYRRLESHARDRARHARLLGQIDAVTAELRRRIGQTFTLAELVQLYDGAEPWARAAVADADQLEGWSRDLALVTDAAFYLYARGARDYEP